VPWWAARALCAFGTAEEDCEICWTTWPRVAGGRRVREALRRAPRKSGLQVARPRKLGLGPVHVPRLVRVLRRAPALPPVHGPQRSRGPHRAHAAGPDRGPLVARQKLVVRAAGPTTWEGRARRGPRRVPAAAFPGQRGVAHGLTAPPGKEGLGAVP